MITSIKICNDGTFNDKGAKIDNLKKSTRLSILAK